MRIPFTTNQLMKIASVGAVFVIGNGILMHYLQKQKFKQSPYFILARDRLLENRPLVALLGEPIEFGNVDLDNRNNFSTPSEAHFQIPILGVNTQGVLYLSAARPLSSKSDVDAGIMDQAPSHSNPASQHDSGWILRSLEITVKDKPNQKLILVGDKNTKTSSESLA